ncbi:hypothetical protein, partial [Nocardioides lijunqiniae]|uniref:hypothetical protein n=1 Tax=Nocardioides lijunqiniae TaxID=2760832 RepID=UPI001878E3CE
ATSRGCLSAPPDPRGSGEDARARPGPPRVGALLRRLHRLERGTRRLARTTRRFEDWESCLTALPVSESGDTEQGLGHLTAGTTYLPGLDLDDSERDDPDYQVLAFAWRDRPGSGRDCDDGDADDRAAAARPREPRSGLRRLRAGLRELREDLGDLEEPVGEITRFDECLYTVGVRERSGFAFRDDRGRVTTRPALQLDLGGASLPQQSWLALPGEEPPQIECRED